MLSSTSRQTTSSKSMELPTGGDRKRSIDLAYQIRAGRFGDCPVAEVPAEAPVVSPDEVQRRRAGPFAVVILSSLGPKDSLERLMRWPSRDWPFDLLVPPRHQHARG